MDWKRSVPLFAGLLLCSFNLRAEVSLFACEPEWQALAQEIGGAKVAAYAATTAQQDPHHIQARPSLIAKLRRADLLVCTGAGLEAGWLPVLLRRARNPRVQPGQPGHLMAAEQVQLLEIPQRLDRSEGDIHADGNPHMHLDPRNILKVAEALAQRLAQIDPDNAGFYNDSLANFRTRWDQAMKGWKGKAAPLAGQGVVVHHTEWIYLLNWLGMERLAALEPKPGVPPSAGHLAQLEARLKQQSVLAIVRSPIDDQRPSEWLSQRSGTPAVVLPYTVGGSEAAGDLFGLFDDSLNQLLEAGQ